MMLVQLASTYFHTLRFLMKPEKRSERVVAQYRSIFFFFITFKPRVVRYKSI